MASESFIRWQERALTLRTHTISVFLGIALATIGFIIDKILDKEFQFRNVCVKIFIALSVIMLLINTTVILILMLNRLKGFRHSTQIANQRKSNSLTGDELGDLRQQSLEIDTNTHWLFETSVILFLLGQLFAVVGFGIQLFPKFF
jgi:hypothetical protein